MFEEYIKALKKVDPEQIVKTAELLNECAEADGRIFIAGNGGSHCIAQHMASDLMKAVGYQKTVSGQAFCLTDNLALITAFSNDFGYDRVFSKQADLYGLTSRDVVICFSVSGASRNIVRLVNLAHDRHSTTIMITGNSEDNECPHIQAFWRLYADWQYITVSSGFDRNSPMHYYICESVFSCIAHAIANEFHKLRGNYSAEE